MLRYLEDHPGVFSPEEVKLLCAALDEAWTKLQASGAPLANDHASEAARQKLAKLIIYAAERGERDLGRLVEEAFEVAAAVNVSAGLQPTPRRSNLEP